MAKVQIGPIHFVRSRIFIWAFNVNWICIIFLIFSPFPCRSRLRFQPNFQKPAPAEKMRNY